MTNYYRYYDPANDPDTIPCEKKCYYTTFDRCINNCKSQTQRNRNKGINTSDNNIQTLVILLVGVILIYFLFLNK